MIGGGVLMNGVHQEEIRFIMNPELITACLFVEELTDNEVLLVTGAERFNGITGYGEGIHYGGNFQDSTPVDPYRRKQNQVVLIDALNVTGRNIPHLDQFRTEYVNRELNKM